MPKWFQNDLLKAGLEAFAIAVVLTPILRDIFRSYNIVDHPGQRKVHVHPIPRIGGIPIAVAYGAALLSLSASSSGGLDIALWKLLPGAGLIFLTGLMDDLFNLRPVVKLAGQMAAALLVFFSGLRLDVLGKADLPLWLNFPLTVFWLLLTTNALNLIDGLDGLCAGVGLLATLTLFGAALLHNNQPLVYTTLPLACALIGFLCYNLNPATVFLGDSGALLIGFLLGCYGMIWTQKTSTLISILVPLIALSLPLLDLILAVVRRMLRRQSIFSADRGHIHHRLLDQGLTPGRAVLVLYMIGGAAAGLAVLLSAPQIARFQNVVIAVILGGVWMGMRKLRYREIHLMGRMVFGGGLQQDLRGKLLLEQLEATLRKMDTPEIWWTALVAAVKDFGWIRMSWDGPIGFQQVSLEQQRPSEPAWSFHILLGEWGSVKVEGCSGKDGLDLVAFAEVLRNSVSNKNMKTKQPAIH